MSVSIRFLGTAAFEIITSAGKRILIDPYLDENPVSPIKVADLDHLDLLLVTHAAHDHLGDTEAILRRFADLKLICGADVRGYLIHRGISGDRLRAIPWGMMIEEAGVQVRPVESHHWSYIQTEDGHAFSSIPLGFIIYAGEGVRIYHSGDTGIFSDLELIGELYKPTVGLINVGVPREHRGAAHGVPEYLTGEMTAEEAAMACRWLRLDYAIPCHHDDPGLPEIVRFADLLKEARRTDPAAPREVILSPGQTFSPPVGEDEEAG
ncbi:MAG: MBL fold metallo-hydrolase [Desulfobacterales bacterium]|nr:MBL fold metallo-hydrolase [Desulfobacterales bacterium]